MGKDKGEGKGKGAAEAYKERESALQQQLVGKEYKESLEHVVRNTAARPSDIDQKALQLLDALQKHGRAKDACAHLRTSLAGVPRDHITNWRAYVYTLLRGFDAEIYNAMKDDKGEGKKKREDKEKAREDRRAARQERLSTNGGGSGQPAENGATHNSTSTLSNSAAEFVPGKIQWSGAVSGVVGPVPSPPGANAQLSQSFTEFVPGKTSHSAPAAEPPQLGKRQGASGGQRQAAAPATAAPPRAADKSSTAKQSPAAPGAAAGSKEQAKEPSGARAGEDAGASAASERVPRPKLADGSGQDGLKADQCTQVAAVASLAAVALALLMRSKRS